jgi:hypothetical protein
MLDLLVIKVLLGQVVLQEPKEVQVLLDQVDLKVLLVVQVQVELQVSQDLKVELDL